MMWWIGLIHTRLVGLSASLLDTRCDLLLEFRLLAVALEVGEIGASVRGQGIGEAVDL